MKPSWQKGGADSFLENNDPFRSSWIMPLTVSFFKLCSNQTPLTSHYFSGLKSTRTGQFPITASRLNDGTVFYFPPHVRVCFQFLKVGEIYFWHEII
jgi:hypothetical protein